MLLDYLHIKHQEHMQTYTVKVQTSWLLSKVNLKLKSMIASSCCGLL